MIISKKNFNNKPLLSLLSLPFFILLVIDGSSPYIITLIGFLLLIDYKFDVTRYYTYSFFIFIFYCNIIFDDTKFTLHDLRLRYFSMIFFGICLLINFYFKKNKAFIKFANIFTIAFSISILTSNYILNLQKFDRNDFLNSLNFVYKKPDFIVEKSTKPVILIILDEFSSTSEIFKYTNDSLDLKLDIYLKNKGYLVNNEAKTKTLRTSLSLPSILNFNLHNSYKNDSIESIDKGLQKINGFSEIFINNTLTDSLNKKSIKTYSYGLLPFQKGNIDEKFYYYWMDKLPNISFIEKIIDKTIIGTLIYGANKETTYIDEFRKQSLNKLKELSPKKNSFYYFHLFFPHDPYSFYNEYPKRDLNYITLSDEEYLNEHIKYKRWFIDKIISVIEDDSLEDCRVIISGDHGFRYNEKINPKLTNTYIKGYKEANVNKIKFIQDLGYLINESF